MESAKDYGFNEGFMVASGDVPPADHTSVGDLNNSWSLAIPNAVLEDEHKKFTEATGWNTAKDPETFGKVYRGSKTILNAAGISKTASPNSLKVGVDFNGQPVYSNPQLANSNDTSPGKMLANTAGMALGSMGAFSDFTEAGRFIGIGDHAQDQAFHQELDNFKSKKDPRGFIEAVSKVGGGAERSLTDYSAYKLYENWNSMSPTQKSVAITGVGMQGFKFQDGQTFQTKRLTPEIPGVPSMNAAEGLDLASQGINVAPATRKWNQVSIIQDTMFTPKRSADIVKTADSLSILGYGEDGRAVEMDKSRFIISKMAPAPHYGVGAATIPQGVGVPTGYTSVKVVNGRTVVIPTVNRSTAIIDAPDVSSKAATDIYSKWPDVANAKQDKGVLGGSALVGGLDSMTSNNPYSLGAVITHSSFEHIGVDKNASDIKHVTHMSGIALNRLVNGKADKSVDSKGAMYAVDGAFDEKTFGSTMKNLRGEYARQGISSKEIGYQLANQGYAEGRFNESQLAAIHRSLDMTFDDNGYVLAQKLLTGKNKGIEITERRRG